jgi:S1-C subfamily serine protease
MRRRVSQRRGYNGIIFDGSDAESPAAKSGLREGDVIQEVNNQPVKNAKDLQIKA